jgi:hypothetical protein
MVLFISNSKEFTSFVIFSSQETVFIAFLFSKTTIAGVLSTQYFFKSAHFISDFASLTGVFCVNHLVAITGSW